MKGIGITSVDKIVRRVRGRHEKTFYTGLKKFIKDCKPLVDSAGNRKCPCKSCRLVLWVSIKNLSRHITNYGFDPSYKTWIHHGELDLPPPLPVIDNTRQPQMSDMTACLNDLSYIPLNNEQNEPTQGDISETSNEPTQAKINKFEELYASANEELYPGCDYVTRLDFMAKFTYFKVKGKLTDSIFNEMLEFFQNVFPTSKGFKLPPSYYPIKKTFKMTGLGHESINACVNDCFLFWGYDNKDVHFCPLCNMSRWKDSNTSGKKVPKKVSLSGWSGQGYKACPTCNKDTPYVRVLGKTTYVGHRRFLKKPHKWRRSLEFNGETEDGDPLREFDRDQIQAQLSRLPTPNLFSNLMEDDILKAQSKVVDILCNLELIYPPAFFDIMIHLVIHLPLEALEGGPIPPRKFPNKDMKEEFPDWFGSQISQRHVDNDPSVSATNELFTLACGPTPTLISVNSCVVNGVRFVVHSRDERRTTQNSGICSPGGKDREMYYDIIDLDKVDGIIDDALLHDLAYSDDEDLTNVDDDDGVEMSADVARGHDGDGGGDDRKGTRKPNLGGRKAGRLHTRQETRNLGLKKITDDKGPVPIRFEWDDKKTMMPLGDHASHWSNYLGELIREMPLYYPSWQKVPAERKAAIVTKIGTQFDLKPHMQSQHWTYINAGIQQHLQKLYNNNKASLKAAHWVINPETGTYDVESIRQRRPENITLADWDAQLAFLNNPRNQARAAQNRQNRAKSTIVCRQGSRSLARLRDQMMESSSTREYPSLIHTFFVTHTIGGVFVRDEDRALYIFFFFKGNKVFSSVLACERRESKAIVKWDRM
ncbi:retrotransposon protein, putative, ty3-gypsy subclass [Tanacetum coccineum]|uniref:Retrotransposon protein, putative, ty3-gypsy subclass n=1 Tax=Tanacetum coccineum TaxID=301880 RepID=A0ABQ5JAB5_9ASTR